MDTQTQPTNIVADKMMRLALAEILDQIRDDVGAATIRLAAILAQYPEARTDLYAAQDACTFTMQSLIGRTHLES